MAAIRPNNLSEYIGQERVKRIIRLELQAGGIPRHGLCYGLAGLGKTSLARVIALEAGLEFVHWQATRNMNGKTLAQALFNLSVDGYDKGGNPGKAGKRYLVFIDEIHAAHPTAFEVLYSPMEDRVLRPDPNGGESWLPHFTLIAATTDPSLLPNPFVSRFPMKLRLDPYSVDEIAAMVSAKYAGLKKCEALDVARRSKGNARQACDYAESVLLHGLEVFDLMEIDKDGWTLLDRAVLDALRRAGRPLSLNTLSAMVREDPATIREIVEPALIAAGLMEITPKGRAAVGFDAARQSRGSLVALAG